MSNRELVKELTPDAAQLEEEIRSALGDLAEDELPNLYEASIQEFKVDTIHTGRILNVVGDDVIVDIGYKSEGIVGIQEFRDDKTPEVGDEVEVYLESVEDESGVIQLSKQKAGRIRGWEAIINTKAEGDNVTGKVIRKIKGGLLIDIGVPVFLPASQVDIRRVEDIGTFLGRDIECKIIKIDERRMNIIVSRRRLLEDDRADQKRELLEEIQEGETREGVVKNIADFGAFVDLGGIDGLLHITDMSWGRISHPSEMVALDQKIKVKVLKVDLERERIALGLKQLDRNPWEEAPLRYPVGSRVNGRVVNILPYGAFVELEEGVEGLVHISEMSWTKRVNHPSEMLSIGDQVEVVVLNVNDEKQEISLGMKQVEANPWDQVTEKYAVGQIISGRVRNMTNYGAFVELEEGIDGLLHVSDISWTKKIMHPKESLQKGEVLEVMVLNVDSEKKRIALGMKQLEENPWESTIPEKYAVGNIVSGTVTKLVSFGAFVELEDNLEGLLHASKLDGGAEDPADSLNVGDVVEVEVLRIEPDEGKIGLSFKNVLSEGSGAPAPAADVSEEAPAEDAPEDEAPAEEPAAEAADEIPADEPAAEATEEAAEASAEEAPAEEAAADEAPAEEAPADEAPAEEAAEEAPAEEAAADEAEADEEKKDEAEG
jgi:small subunit ribosomal protein S1